MNVVGYCRLSRDDDRANYSSIEEQKIMIEEYALSQNWQIKDYFIDDNISGYTFDRPAFNKMLEELNNNRIDTIIIKDLSRLGRNNGRTLVFLDDLEAMGRNLIILHHTGGVFNLLQDTDDIIGITTWYNERYVKDASRKVRASMLSKQKTGRLIMGNYFGYIKDPNDKTKLLIDESIKHIIEEVFELYVYKGYGRLKIAKEMTSRGYFTPSKYYYNKKLEEGKIYGHKVQSNWTVDMVSNILKNEVYTGTLITHKKQTVGIRGKIKKLPEEQHFRFENHHEAIVSKEMFDTANKIRETRKNKMTSPVQREYFFKGFTKCGECGNSASGKSIKRASGRIKGYCCCTYVSQGLSGCKASEISEELILAHFKEFLKQTMITYRDIINTIELKSVNDNKTNLEKTLKQRQLQLENKIKMLISERIRDLVNATDNSTKDIIIKTYQELENSKKQELLNIVNQLEEIKKLDKTKVKKQLQSSLEYYEQILKYDTPPYYLLEQVLSNIYIYRDKTIKFNLKLNIDELCV